MTNKRRFIVAVSMLAALALTFALTGCGSSTNTNTSTGTGTNSNSTGQSASTTDEKLQVKDLKVGTGAAVKSGDTVTVNYSGWLYVNGQKTTEFDSSTDSSFNHVQPFTTQIGVGNVIAGWDQGIVGMKVGGERSLIIPPSLGYGAQANGAIPANSTLYFEVSLLSIGAPAATTTAQ